MKLHNLERNFVIWSIVTIICAAPSFKIAASEGFDIVAMLLGITFIIAGYTFASSTSFYQNIKTNKIYFNRALKISFGFKVINALIAIPINLKIDGNNIFFYITDIYAGIFAFGAIRELFGYTGEKQMKEFLPTFITTLTEAVIMSLFLLFIAFLIWTVIRIWRLIFKKKSVTNNK